MAYRKRSTTYLVQHPLHLVLLIGLVLVVTVLVLLPQIPIRGDSPDADARAKINLAMAHLSKLLGKTIQYPGGDYQQFLWNRDQYYRDGSLGCAQPGLDYPKVKTRFYQIQIKVDYHWYEYRISMDGATLVYLKDNTCQIQTLTSCSAVAEKAIQTSSQHCTNLSSDSICYGNSNVEIQPAGLTFSTPGDQVNVSQVQSLRMGLLDNSNGNWGIIQMNVTPQEDPSQTINMVLFGDVQMEEVPASGYAPMQAFTLNTGRGNLQCADIDLDGILIQTQDNQAVKVKVEINQVVLSLGSTVFVQSLPNEMLVYSLGGNPEVAALGTNQAPPPGSYVRIPLQGNAPSGPPSAPLPYQLNQLGAIPIRLLSRPISLPAPIIPLRASIRTNRSRGTLPLTVSFTNASTGTYTGQGWNFGDGASSSEANPTHTYTQAGTYTVSLQVIAADGTASDPATTVITVQVPIVPPVAQIKAGPLSGNRPLTVSFTNASTGTFTGQAWDFGDGGTSREANPTHTYATAGTYTAWLWVYAPDGAASKPDSVTVTVRVPFVPPVAQIKADPVSGGEPLTVSFTNASTGTFTGQAWNFGDGTAISREANPKHTYHSAGDYTVYLWVYTPDGKPSKPDTLVIHVLFVVE